MDKLVDLYLNNAATRQKWEAFLASLDIHNFSDRELDQINHTLGLVDEEGKLVGTGSVAGNVLKYVGVCNKGVTSGARFNKIVTALQQYIFNEKIFHSFVFTKAKYSESFQHLNFRELAKTDQAAFLESGTPDVDNYLADLPKVNDQKDLKIGAIVMNANPFTLGHRHLVELASEENDLVYVFVVKEDASLFTTDERMELVRAGLADLANVKVVSGGDYMVSKATFPAYFLKSPEDLIDVQTAIDARVFKNVIAPSLNITRRYLGKEPLSMTTHYYNVSLAHELSPDIEVITIPRKEVNGDVITATEIRQKIKAGDLAGMKELVPATTLEFIEKNLASLQARIEKGMNINGN
ncbi:MULTISPECIES: [citrate (pro-3S)-lyase] ligase [Lactobacillus]|uniref:[citrate (pro-3S)-lyase] ligase n=1 Tax=Lactobacillus TaxID=1578 RepID=UPI000CD92B59|nr:MULTISPECIES: [citrate (pro-3S)-lyase] ligase [Lactobacillus]RVU73377.1 [citrate (pro-3S)-lyase] ligase [Lactobacillus xujianguonis]